MGIKSLFIRESELASIFHSHLLKRTYVYDEVYDVVMWKPVQGLQIVALEVHGYDSLWEYE